MREVQYVPVEALQELVEQWQERMLSEVLNAQEHAQQEMRKECADELQALIDDYSNE
jgi:hypothetical protein